jgi:RNA polymerase sigma-70 factor (ECF subfamily)
VATQAIRGLWRRPVVCDLRGGCAKWGRPGGAKEEERETADAGAFDGATPPFEQIVAEYGPLISRIAMSYESDPGLREDLTQQIFLAVWQAMPSYRHDASLKTFIARIAQNRSISFVAKQVRQPPVAEMTERVESDQPDPEQSAIETSERRRLLEATRQLPLPQRDVIILVLEGFSYPEIADMLNIAPNALALRLSRAKAALKKMLEPTP